MEETDWDAYGTGNYEKCADCMVHSGYEATAVMDTVRHPLKAAAVALRGVRTKGEMAPEIPLDRQRPAEYVLSGHVDEAMARLGERRPARARRGRARLAPPAPVRVSRASPIKRRDLPRPPQHRGEHAGKIRGSVLGERDQRRRRQFARGRVGDRAHDDERDAGCRGDAGDHIAFEVDGERAGFGPGAALFGRCRENAGGSQHRSFERADAAPEVGDAGGKAAPARASSGRSAMTFGRNDHVARAQLRRQAPRRCRS